MNSWKICTKCGTRYPVFNCKECECSGPWHGEECNEANCSSTNLCGECQSEQEELTAELPPVDPPEVPCEDSCARCLNDCRDRRGAYDPDQDPDKE